MSAPPVLAWCRQIIAGRVAELAPVVDVIPDDVTPPVIMIGRPAVGPGELGVQLSWPVTPIAQRADLAQAQHDLDLLGWEVWVALGAGKGWHVDGETPHFRAVSMVPADISAPVDITYPAMTVALLTDLPTTFCPDDQEPPP